MSGDRERLLEIALSEALAKGGRPAKRATRRPVLFGVAVAAVVIAAAALVWRLGTTDPVPLVADVEVVVHRGLVIAEEVYVFAGGAVVVGLAPGDRLRAGNEGAKFSLGRSEFEAEATSELRVRRTPLWLQPATLSLEVVRGTLRAGDAEAPMKRGALIAVGAGGVPPEEDPMGEWQAALVEFAAPAHSETRTASVEVPDVPAAARPEPVPVFSTPANDVRMHAVDWPAVGETLHAMLAAVDSAHRTVLAGEQPTVSVLAAVHRDEGVLIGLLQPVLPRSSKLGENGAMTVPAIAVNLASALLTVAGVPLDAEQRASVQRIVTYHAGIGTEERDTRGLALEWLQRSAERQAQFFRELFAVLGQPQRAALTSASRNGYDVDVFGGAFLWRPFISPVETGGCTEFGAQVTARLRLMVEGVGALPAAAERAVAAWAEGLPSELFGARATPLERGPWQTLRTARVRLAVEHQLRLWRELSAAVDDREVLAVLRSSRQLFVPLPRE